MTRTHTRILMILAAVAATAAAWYDWPLGAAAIALIAVINDRLLHRIDDLQQRSGELALLVEMSELLQLSKTHDEASDILPTYAQRLFPAFDGALFVAGTASMEVAASWGAPPAIAAFASGDCWALRRAHAHVVSADAAELACRHSVSVSSTATICLPMLAGGQAIGVLALRTRETTRISQDVQLFAKAFADQIALALANLRLQDTLRTRAVRDSLTGLFNRRWMEETLQHELLRCARAGTRAGVVIVDVDCFKQYNDTWGHAGGDALLQQLARVMQRVFREEDVICRFGGDEFVIVLPDTSFEHLRDSAERLCAESRQLQVHLDGQLLGPVTISAGIALTPGHAATVDGVIAAADRALYAAKSGGRDRVATPPHLVGLDAA